MSQPPNAWTQLHLADEERRLRTQAEQKAEALSRLLEELANRLTPEQAEQARRADPTHFQRLDAGAWRAYWQGALMRNAGWGQVTADAVQLQMIRRQVEVLRTENEALQQEVEMLQYCRQDGPLAAHTVELVEAAATKELEVDRVDALQTATLPAIALPDRPPRPLPPGSPTGHVKASPWRRWR